MDDSTADAAAKPRFQRRQRCLISSSLLHLMSTEEFNADFIVVGRLVDFNDRNPLY